jgi:polar amino acid transport system substrate-binding protein
VDALAIDVTRANEAIANDSSLALLDEALGSEQYGIGFRKNDTELCDLVNAALDALAADGTVDAIAQGYPRSPSTSRSASSLARPIRPDEERR